MKVRYKNNNRTIVYPKGASLQEVKNCIIKRMEKRQGEMDKREWIVKEYKSLEEKQCQDREWLAWLNAQDPEEWGGAE